MPVNKKKPGVTSKMKQAEKEYQKMLDSGKVKDIGKARKKIMDKYGVYPLGRTR